MTHIFSYLQPGTHAAVALVSKRFYSLITTPHAWRMAFLRYFPGQEAAALSGTPQVPDDSLARSETRRFGRLTALASWRSEYLLRTRLLRSLLSGKPGLSVGVNSTNGYQGLSSSGKKVATHAKKPTAVITYNSQLLGVVDQLQAAFVSSGKKTPRVVHGSSSYGVVTSSNPALGKLEGWGYNEPYLAEQLDHILPGMEPYGLGLGRAAVPNVMDVSSIYGAIVGEGFPGGRPLTRALGDRNFAYLESSLSDRFVVPEPDMPIVPKTIEAVCAVWVAKTSAVPTITKSMVGFLTGSSLGVVSAYSLDKANSASRYPFTQVTARWVLSPGVPIIAINVDDSYTEKRRAARRVWAVALNALGEVYYLQDVPSVPSGPGVPATLGSAAADWQAREKLAWQTGRSAAWELVEVSRRTVTADWFDERSTSLKTAASSSPRTSPDSLGLVLEQRAAEAREIERYFDLMPSHFCSVYDSWDMRLKLEVDFAGGSASSSNASSKADGVTVSGTAENIVVVSMGEGQESMRNPQPAKVVRYTRLVAPATTQETGVAGFSTPILSTASSALSAASVLSVFSSGQTPPTPAPSINAGEKTPRSNLNMTATATVGWQTTNFALKGNNVSSTESNASPDSSPRAQNSSDAHPPPHSNMKLTCLALDLSLYSLVAPFEDALLLQNTEIPGRRARWLAVGTKSGRVIVWNMREAASISTASEPETVWPLRVIRTSSPAISSLAVSALYLVHGGHDGLVQAWDPLASTTDPIRTLNTSSAGRIPRHLTHLREQLSPEMFASVGAIFLDPEPTVLRGVLAVGTLLRYWSYNSSGGGGGHHASRKKGRRLRHTNADGQLVDRRLSGEKVTDFIAAETAELRRERQHDERHRAHLQRRFGVGLAGLSEEEAVRYAEIMSREAFFLDEQRRSPGSGSSSSGLSSSALSSASTTSTLTTDAFPSSFSETAVAGGANTSMATEPEHSSGAAEDDDFELQMQRAMRLSLMESGAEPDEGTVALKTSQKGSSPAPHFSSAAGSSAAVAGPSKTLASTPLMEHHAVGDNEDADLRLALQLSMQEEESRQQAAAGGSSVASGLTDESEQYANDAALAALLQDDEFPVLEVKYTGKGKGR